MNVYKTAFYFFREALSDCYEREGKAAERDLCYMCGAADMLEALMAAKEKGDKNDEERDDS